ncbi:ATP-binding protein [Carboxylicivirga sp. N1Y90]|uniref:ATP-binding protein n=1 Tax=Carboxylicivirga fragile TaxID=3417571 RepID=UPI003D33BEDB|nr:transporter substrate-binding domain-containing protein [Marinilabiliaceae bacterium N1Y90]
MPKLTIYILLLCLSFGKLGANNVTLARDIKVGVYHNPPLIYTDSLQQAKGIFIDILERIADNNNWQLSYQNYHLKQGLDALKNNEIDILPGIAFSKERAKQFIYSDEVIFTNWGVIYKNEHSSIQNISDINGSKIGLEKGDIQAIAFSQLLRDFNFNADIIWYDNSADLLSDLMQHKIEAAAINKVIGHYYYENESILETSILFNPVNLHFVSNDPQLLSDIDLGVLKLQSETPELYKSIIDQWLVTNPTKVIPTWLKIAIITLTISILILAFTLFILKKIINKQDKNLKEEYKQKLLNKKLIDRLEIEKALILNSIDDQVVFIDPNYRILWANAAFKNRQSVPFEKLVGEKCHKAAFKNNEPCSFCQYENSLLSKQTETYEHYNESSKNYFSTKTSPVYDSEDVPIGFVKVITDITDKKRNEWELIEAKEKAEESDLLKSTFLANMSHEIRTPMNAIIGFSELLDDNTITEDEKSSYVNIIQSNGQQLLKLISDILVFSQLESGHLELQYSTINVAEFLQEIYQQFKTEKDKLNNLQLSIDLDINQIDTNLSIETDAIRLKQILFNLLTNALKFTKEGKILIKAKTKNDLLLLSVSDTGIGIPDDQLKNIFRRFSQVENNQMKKAAGSGLGLSITKELIHLLGGSIEVSTKLNYGSKFSVIHPLHSKSDFRLETALTEVSSN